MDEPAEIGAAGCGQKIFLIAIAKLYRIGHLTALRAAAHHVLYEQQTSVVRGDQPKQCKGFSTVVQYLFEDAYCLCPTARNKMIGKIEVAEFTRIRNELLDQVKSYSFVR